MRKNPYSALASLAKDAKESIESGMENLASFEIPVEYSFSFEALSSDIETIKNNINKIVALDDNLEKYGYDQGVIDVCNADGQLHRILNIDPDDILGKSPSGLKDVYQANAWDSIKSWLEMARVKIVAFIKQLIKYLMDGLAYFNRERNTRIAERLKSNLDQVDVSKLKLPTELSIRFKDWISRMNAITDALIMYKSASFNRKEIANTAFIVNRVVNPITNIVGLYGILIDTQGVAHSRPFNTHTGTTYKDLGWVGANTIDVTKLFNKLSKDIPATITKLEAMSDMAQDELDDTYNMPYDPNHPNKQDNIRRELGKLIDGFTLLIAIPRGLFKVLQETYIVFGQIAAEVERVRNEQQTS